MKKLMVMAAALTMAMAANAQTSPEAKAIKKMKSYAEVQEALKANEANFGNDDKAFVYNKLVDLAISESEKAEKASIEAQLAKNEQQQQEMLVAKNVAGLNAIENALKCNAVDDAGKFRKKNASRLMTIRNSMVQAGLDCYNTKDYANATKFFGAFVETRHNALFADADFSTEQNFGQIAYYAALAAYFGKDMAKCNDYSDIALKSQERDSIANDVIIVKLGALEEQAKTAAIDTVTFTKIVKDVYDQFPDNENVFGKLVALYDESGKKDLATSLLSDRIAKDPNDVMANAYIGQNAQNELKYDEAITAYTRALQGRPDFLVAKLNLGVCYLNKAVGIVEKNTDARGVMKPEVKPEVMEHLNQAKKVLEEVKAADPDKTQVNWAYPLERVNYAIENVQ